MASKRAFLTEDVETEMPGDSGPTDSSARLFEEPPVEDSSENVENNQEESKKNKDGTDKFGKTPLPTGNSYYVTCLDENVFYKFSNSVRYNNGKGDTYLRKKKKVGKVTDHIRLQKHLSHTRKRDRKAAQRAELASILDPCEGGAMSSTKVYSQADIVRHADVQTMQKKFTLTLEMGPYVIDYDASGRHLLLAGRRGHIAMIDHLTKKPKAEFTTNEVVTVMDFQQPTYFYE